MITETRCSYNEKLPILQALFVHERVTTSFICGLVRGLLD
jgi:hypothetical protein